MLKYAMALALLGGVFSSTAQQQLTQVLQAIEANNKSLQAAEKYKEAKSLEFHSGITPDDPMVSATYLFANPASAANAYELEFMQGFDFPTAYGKMKQTADAQSQLLNKNYEQLKQDILLQAKIAYLELVYWQQYTQFLEERLERANAVLDDFKEQFNAGRISELELSKAQIQQLGLKGQLNTTQSKVQLQKNKLTSLNGGQVLSLNQAAYPPVPENVALATIIDSVYAEDKGIQMLQQQQAVYESQLGLSKALSLPKLEAGYRLEAEPGMSFNGLHFGMSLPLWQNKNTIKASKAQLELGSYQMDEYKTQRYYQVKQLYEQYVQLQQTIGEYEQLMQNLNSEAILDKSLELGGIDFITYALELEYFYNAQDELLSLQKEAQLLLAELFKYEL